MLTEFQKQWMADTFFKSHRYPGGIGIGKTMLDRGYAIVAGNPTIWIGGVNEFISREVVEGLHDRWKFTFDLSGFLRSSYISEYISLALSAAEEKMIQQQLLVVKAKEEFEGIKDLAIMNDFLFEQ